MKPGKRGNKEAKKAKKTAPAALPAVTSGAAPAVGKAMVAVPPKPQRR